MAISIHIKSNSPVQQIIDVLENEPELTKLQLHDRGYSWTDVHMVWQLVHHPEKYQIGRQVDLVPMIATSAASTGEAESPHSYEEVRWPGSPSIASRLEHWQRPPWYTRLHDMVKLGRHIALSGPPGIGKSTAILQLAAEQKVPLVVIGSDSGLRRRDLTGTTELVNRHTQFLVAEYAAAAVNGWWAMIDEANAAEPDALMFLNGQIAPPYAVALHGRAYPVHRNFRLFITYNPGLVGTKPLPDSFKDRFFPIKLEFPGPKQLRRILVANGMSDDGDTWQDTLVAFGTECWAQHVKGRCRYQITPRRLMDAVTLIQQGESVASALKCAVVDAVDNPAEAEVLKIALRTVCRDGYIPASEDDEN